MGARWMVRAAVSGMWILVGIVLFATSIPADDPPPPAPPPRVEVIGIAPLSDVPDRYLPPPDPCEVDPETEGCGGLDSFFEGVSGLIQGMCEAINFTGDPEACTPTASGEEPPKTWEDVSFLIETNGGEGLISWSIWNHGRDRFDGPDVWERGTGWIDARAGQRRYLVQATVQWDAFAWETSCRSKTGTASRIRIDAHGNEVYPSELVTAVRYRGDCHGGTFRFVDGAIPLDRSRPVVACSWGCVRISPRSPEDRPG